MPLLSFQHTQVGECLSRVNGHQLLHFYVTERSGDVQKSENPVLSQLHCYPSASKHITPVVLQPPSSCRSRPCSETSLVSTAGCSPHRSRQSLGLPSLQQSSRRSYALPSLSFHRRCPRFNTRSPVSAVTCNPPPVSNLFESRSSSCSFIEDPSSPGSTSACTVRLTMVP